MNLRKLHHFLPVYIALYVMFGVAMYSARAARVLACSGAWSTDHAKPEAEKLPRQRFTRAHV